MGLRDHPVGQVAAVRSAHGAETIGVGDPVLHHLVDAFKNILEVALAPGILDHVQAGASITLPASRHGHEDRDTRARVRAIEVTCTDSPEAELRLVGNRGTIAKAPVDEGGRVTATPPETDTWCCAELWTRAGDSLLAVTSPIYLV